VRPKISRQIGAVGLRQIGPPPRQFDVGTKFLGFPKFWSGARRGSAVAGKGWGPMGLRERASSAAFFFQILQKEANKMSVYRFDVWPDEEWDISFETEEAAEAFCKDSVAFQDQWLKDHPQYNAICVQFLNALQVQKQEIFGRESETVFSTRPGLNPKEG
jgi:hypothetical protein